VHGNTEPNSKLSLGGKKALIKAIEACQKLKIDYLRMDQLCINQDNTKEGHQEKAQEIRKMHQYYSNATVTLVSINTNVNEKRTNNDTLVMFDREK